MIGFQGTIQEHAGKEVFFQIDYLLTGAMEEEVHPRNEAEAAAALQKAATHRHFAMDVNKKYFETVNLLQRAIQGSWKDMTMIFVGVRYKAKNKHDATVFDTVRLEGVQARGSEVDEEGYRFHFNVWGDTTEKGAEE
jgi:hypothetical protein